MNFFKPSFDWSEDYCIGIDALDTQHRQMFHLLNRMLVLDKTDDVAKSLKSLPGLLKELNEYAAYHLTFEESLMKQHLAPDADMVAHITEHRVYWQRIAEFEQRLAAGDPQSVHGLTVFLDYWWNQHIQHADRRLGARLQQAGLS